MPPMRITYSDFLEFIDKHFGKRDKFGGVWFQFDERTGAVCVGRNRYDYHLWIYDGYIPHYENGMYIGHGYRSSVINTHDPVKPVFDASVDENDRVILVDVYGEDCSPLPSTLEDKVNRKIEDVSEALRGMRL